MDNIFRESTYPTLSSGKLVLPQYERHVQVPATYPSTPAFNPAVGEINSAIYCLVFATTGTEFVYFQWEIPTDIIPSTNVLVEIDWCPYSGAMSGTDTVEWTAVYVTRAQGGLFSGTTTAPTSIVNSDDNSQ